MGSKPPTLIRIASAQPKGARLHILITRKEFVNVKELGKTVGAKQKYLYLPYRL